jgi:DNA-binding transcriptional ArsR family regulator
MKQIFTIRSLEDLKTVCHPTRILLFENLSSAARTIPELAELIDEVPSRLYYHVAELERIGLIEVVRTRKKGNLIERVYRATAPYVRVDPTVFQSGAEGLDALLKAVSAILDTTSLRFQQTLRERRLGDDLSSLLYAYNDLRVPPDKVAEVARRLRALLDELKQLEEPEAPVRAGLSIVCFPIEERGS